MDALGMWTSPERPSGHTSRILILVGLIVQAVGILVILIVGVAIASGPPQIPAAFAAIFGVLAVVGIVWLILVYTFSYRTVVDRDYAGARTPTLVIGVLSLVTGNAISGILYIAAYVKLGDAIEETARASRAPSWGGSPAPYLPPTPAGVPATIPGTRFCPVCGTPTAPDSRFCIHCASPLTP